MTHVKSFCLAVTLLCCFAFNPFHHGWADYDQNKALNFSGTIQEIAYENPHATARIRHNKKIWNVFLAPISRMEARGITAVMVTKGATVQVVGYPHKKIKDEMRAERIFIDGTKYELR